MTKHYRKENDCLNCGHLVNGKFCSECGQENLETHEPFWHFVSHGVGHYFHYDSKFIRTIKSFLKKPGQLTIDHIEGRRARHIPPVSLYIFITLVYFLCRPVFEKSSDKDSRRQEMVSPSTTDINSEERIYPVFRNLSVARQETEIKKLESIIGQTKLDPAQQVILEGRLNNLKRMSIRRQDSTVAAYRHRQAQLEPSQRDDVIGRLWNEKKIRYRENTGEEFDADKMLEKYYPKLLFILMPLFAFFLMLNFRKNKRLYMDHLIYTIHLFSFAYLSFFISEFLQFCLPEVLSEYIDTFFGLVLIWYTYRSIRNVYQRSRWVTVRKLFSISVLFLVSFVITVLLGMGILAAVL